MKDRIQLAADPRLCQLSSELKAGKIERRDFLRRAVAIGLSASAAYAVLSSAQASAQTVTSMALGEETSIAPVAPPIHHPLPTQGMPGQGTTLMVGEEVTVNPGPVATTRALGEETATQPTTMAVGEESIGQPTTMAIGEETVAPPISNPSTRAFGEESSTPPSNNLTTQRVGEEVSSPPIMNPSSRALGEEGTVAPPTNISTFAMGEEGTSPPVVTPSTRRMGEESNPPAASTMAEGEEGPIICFPKQYNAPPVNSRNRPGPMIEQLPTQPWRNFRRW